MKYLNWKKMTGMAKIWRRKGKNNEVYQVSVIFVLSKLKNDKTIFFPFYLSFSCFL